MSNIVGAAQERGGHTHAPELFDSYPTISPANPNLTGVLFSAYGPYQPSLRLLSVAARDAVPLGNRPPPRRSEFLAGATLASLIRRRSSPQRRRPRPSAASGAPPPSPTASAAAQQLHLGEDWRVLPSSRSSLASAGSGRRRCRCSSLRVAAASSVRRLSSAILRRRRSSLLVMTRRSSSSSPMWQRVFSSSASITSIITSGFVAAAAVAPWKGGRRWTERLGGGDCNVLVYCYEFSKLIQVL